MNKPADPPESGESCIPRLRELTESLTHDELELDSFFRLSKDLMCIVASNAYIIKINPAWKSILGLEESEILSKTFIDMIHPDDRTATAAELGKMTVGPIRFFTNRWPMASGGYKAIEWSATRWQSNGRAYAVGRDVTDRREDAFGFITIGADGIIKSVDEYAAHVFGYEPTELIDSNVSILMPQPYKGEHQGYLDNYIKSGISHIIGIGRTVDGAKKNGDVVTIQLSVSELESRDGRVFVGQIVDLTLQKRAEDAWHVRHRTTPHGN